MRKCKSLPWIVFFFLFSMGSSAQTKLARFEIRDPNQPGMSVPVRLFIQAGLIPQGSNFSLYENQGNQRKRVSAQIRYGVKEELSWVFESAGSGIRSFELEQGGQSEEALKMQCSLNDTSLIIFKDQQQILHYRHALLPPPPGQAEKWARSGFIHPLYSPSGQLLTWAQPPDHFHHMGLWNPWTRVSWADKQTDFWNLGEEQGTVRFKDIRTQESGPVYAEFRVSQEHIAFTKPDESLVMNEEWIVRVWNLKEGYYLDFTSLIQNVTSDSISLDAYRYGGGIGYRATEKWNNKNSEVLTSEGKTWENGDATRARWCRVSGDLQGIETGLLFMSDPGNYDAPQPMRIWPKDSNGGIGHQYFEFTPIREIAWVLAPDKTYSQNYRIWVQEGSLDPVQMESSWQIYATPPVVNILYLKQPNQQKKVLIYTRNGEGFVHDNIEASVQMLQELCAENQILTEVSDDPGLFNPAKLSEFAALIFSNTNNEAFTTDSQRDAFKSYIQQGGGFVGIHSACGSERDWPWFWQMLGGTFVRHCPYQTFSVKITDPNHPSTSFFKGDWEWEDEGNYLHQLNPDIHVLLSHDLTTIEDAGKKDYPGTIFGDQYPGAWCHEFDGGREWYTSYGHHIKHYSDPNFRQHVLGGILWVLNK